MKPGWVLVGLAIAATAALTDCSSSVAGQTTGAATTSASTSPAPSPSKGHIVWGHWDDDENLHLFTANADGTNIQSLLPRLGWVGAPNWSPDGQRLALYVGGSGLAAADQADDVLVTGGIVNADGTGFYAFDSPDRTLNVACFEWAPDGDRLACEGFDDSDPSRDGLYTVRATNGGDLRPSRPATGSRSVGIRPMAPGSPISKMIDTSRW